MISDLGLYTQHFQRAHENAEPFGPYISLHGIIRFPLFDQMKNVEIAHIMEKRGFQKTGLLFKAALQGIHCLKKFIALFRMGPEKYIDSVHVPSLTK